VGEDLKTALDVESDSFYVFIRKIVRLVAHSTSTQPHLSSTISCKTIELPIDISIVLKRINDPTVISQASTRNVLENSTEKCQSQEF
jgi:hypothetical protein